MSSFGVIKFSAEWCGPCKMYAPAFERVADQYPFVYFESIDIDEDPETAQRFSIASVPTTLIVKNGQEVSRLAGAQSTSALSRFVNGHL